MDKKLLSLLVCPVCKSTLKLDREKNELICKADALAFQIEDGIPVMLQEKARPLSTDEKLAK